MVSSTFSFKAIASIISIISAANAHMIMKSPIPYGRGSINNSPLDKTGSDYPCKNIFDMTDPVNDVNHLVIGQSNTLSFTGSAVHGGGSCQVSLTTDLRPTKGSTWMVIKSIEGGCPANVDGNLPADPNGSGASTFQYSIPEGIAPGEYTIAWTWFNRIGNREMYMNCGRANIVGSKKRYAPTPKHVQARAGSFPDLFKANLDIFPECKVPETFNAVFPQAGAIVQTAAAGSFTKVCGGGAGADTPAPTVSAGSGSGSGGSQTGAPVVTSAANTMTSAAAGGAPTGGFATGGFASGGAGAPGGMATSSAVAVSSAFGSQPTGGPGVFASGAASSAAAAPSAAAPTADPVPQPAASAAPAPSSGSSSGGSGTSPASGSNTAGSPCPNEGAWLCAASGQSFQRCASGAWSAPMQVAAGTTCTPGESMNLSMKVVTGGFHKRGPSHQHPKRAIRISS